MVSTPSPPGAHRPPAADAGRHSSAFGAPCWASLATPDTEASQHFYRSVMGWEFRRTALGQAYCVALSAGVPTASLGEATPALQVAGDWTSYFCVPDAGDAVARIMERSGTLAVGPVRTPIGRGALAADRDGSRFGVWEGDLVADWNRWRAHRPWRLELCARDVFEAAVFYGEVLDWARDRPGYCEVRYEHDSVVLRDAGCVAARIIPADVDPADGGPADGSGARSRKSPRWNLYFPVPDARAAASAASRYGGGTIGDGVEPGFRSALLHDPHGAVFGVFSHFGEQ
jgi:predicted enzyme related to lactoylglutathione lyase